MGYLSLGESDPRPIGPGPGFYDFIFSYCAISFWTFLILRASLQAGRGKLGLLRRPAVLVSLCFSRLRRVLPVFLESQLPGFSRFCFFVVFSVTS